MIIQALGADASPFIASPGATLEERFGGFKENICNKPEAGLDG
ncbi:MAG TPA: hypothetical protein VF753_14180 [Terriglobales bacterium]